MNRHGINPKTVAKWRQRRSLVGHKTGPKDPRSTVLSIEEEAIIVAFRRHTLLPPDDGLYALQAIIPRLRRSSLHRCLQRHDGSRLPDVEGDKPRRSKFNSHPIGFFHVDIAEVRTEQGRLYMFVAIDRTSKFAFVEPHETAKTAAAREFPERLIAAVPYTIHTVLTDNAIHFTTPGTGGSAFRQTAQQEQATDALHITPAAESGSSPARGRRESRGYSTPASCGVNS